MLFQPNTVSEGVESIIAIDSREIGTADNSQLKLQIPTELSLQFVNMSGRSDGGIRIVSAIYNNVGQLFPSSRPNTTE